MTSRTLTRRVAKADAGTGVLGTVFGVAVFLVLLLVAVQVIFDLYARTSVSAVAFDAAHTVAGADAGGTPAAQARAEHRARAELGRFGERVVFTWTVDADDVRLRVTVHNPSVVPRLVSEPLGLDSIDRTVVIRRELFR